MSGKCRYCGFVGTNDELADHAGEMCHENMEQNFNSLQQLKPKMPSLQQYMQWALEPDSGGRSNEEIYTYFARHWLPLPAPPTAYNVEGANLQTHDTGSPKLPCAKCDDYSLKHTDDFSMYKYCPYCGRQLRAGA